MGDIPQSLIWVGLAALIVVIFMVLEMLLRSLTNRYGTPQQGYSNRNSNQVKS
jgi:hypothetical protein